MVNVHSHASKHAKVPKNMAISRDRGTFKKLDNLSNLMALDSYGMSAVDEG